VPTVVVTRIAALRNAALQNAALQSEALRSEGLQSEALRSVVIQTAMVLNEAIRIVGTPSEASRDARNAAFRIAAIQIEVTLNVESAVTQFAASRCAVNQSAAIPISVQDATRAPTLFG